MLRSALLGVTFFFLNACSSATENTDVQVSGVVSEIDLTTQSFVINRVDGDVTELIRLRLKNGTRIEVAGSDSIIELADVSVGSRVDAWLTSAAMATEYPSVAEVWRVVVRR